jgi:redox-sensitive bicupin YhaK (pirin superfamily)
MITLRHSKERGHAKHDWLETFHTFSFADYQDPNHMHFRNLRVINQDIVQPETGFETHSHHDMEIITYIIRGEITHQDSMGNKTIIKSGEIQRMSAGTGVTHSEHNYGKNILELLQIWIFPDQKNLTPSYEQLQFTKPHNALLLHPLHIHQDVKIFTGQLDQQENIEYVIPENYHVWVQLISGKLEINDQLLNPGDGAAISDENKLMMTAHENSDFLVLVLN